MGHPLKGFNARVILADFFLGNLFEQAHNYMVAHNHSSGDWNSNITEQIIDYCAKNKQLATVYFGKLHELIQQKLTTRKFR